MRTAPGDAATRTCRPELNVADAISVAISMRMFIRERGLPPDTAQVYYRVADQLLAAARVAMAESSREDITVDASGVAS